LLVLPSLNTFEADLATFVEVVLFCDLLCVRVLAATDLTVLLVEVLKAFEAFFAVLLLVIFAIVYTVVVMVPSVLVTAILAPILKSTRKGGKRIVLRSA